ncbi:hypothetical protein CFIMG_004616RAa [Ceratocystis fimbriata CBS 114723]|uniref:Uncharacterized protein n=1 Tax=Ceratocystis fimbriata CBS 114723 TaxID=1035309 RepID=A0A2C5X2Z4_9PEZI|nr:hypothetical protein CFIMG_004616RAa [Ceratocystis fimbriata CBS 114723]
MIGCRFCLFVAIDVVPAKPGYTCTIRAVEEKEEISENKEMRDYGPPALLSAFATYFITVITPLSRRSLYPHDTCHGTSGRQLCE